MCPKKTQNKVFSNLLQKSDLNQKSLVTNVAGDIKIHLLSGGCLSIRATIFEENEKK